MLNERHTTALRKAAEGGVWADIAIFAIYNGMVTGETPDFWERIVADSKGPGATLEVRACYLQRLKRLVCAFGYDEAIIEDGMMEHMYALTEVGTMRGRTDAFEGRLYSDFEWERGFAIGMLSAGGFTERAVELGAIMDGRYAARDFADDLSQWASVSDILLDDKYDDLSDEERLQRIAGSVIASRNARAKERDDMDAAIAEARKEAA